jgi:hypothetical protein
MAMDKAYWIDFHFRKDRIPDILCPTCSNGKLKIKQDFQNFNTRRSRELSQLEYFHETDYEEKFVGFLECENASCKEIVAVAGSMYAEPDNPVFDDLGEYLGQSWYTHLRPEYISPALQIIQIKKEYPKTVSIAIKNSFPLFFFDVESCANKIRIAIETLLDELSVKRTFINTRGKRESYKLHKRIELYKATNNEIGELMLSVKWIGNFGSHTGSLRREDLLDAYLFLETIMDKLYDDKLRTIVKLAKTINKNKKPASKIKKKTRP